MQCVPSCSVEKCEAVGGAAPCALPRLRRRPPAPRPVLRALRCPLCRLCLVCRGAQWASPALVVGRYALSAADSSLVTSPCTLGW